jgi:nitrate reductase delta subunit
MFYRILSALLDYPEEGEDGLYAHLSEMSDVLAADLTLSRVERETIQEFIARLQAHTSEERSQFAADYVRFFDLRPELSLHLTHHLLGDDKNRGPALIDLSEYYQSWGLTISAQELPDYLPLMLEFIASLQPADGERFLAPWRRVLAQLAAHLAAAACPHASLVDLLVQRASAGDTDAAQRDAASLQALAPQLAALFATHPQAMAQHVGFGAAGEDFHCEDERGTETPVRWDRPPQTHTPIQFHPTAPTPHPQRTGVTHPPSHNPI